MHVCVYMYILYRHLTNACHFMSEKERCWPLLRIAGLLALKERMNLFPPSPNILLETEIEGENNK